MIDFEEACESRGGSIHIFSLIFTRVHITTTSLKYVEETEDGVQVRFCSGLQRCMIYVEEAHSSDRNVCNE